MENWAGNYEFQAARVHRPSSVEEIQAIVAGARRVKAAGTHHSFNDVADTPEDIVSTERLDRIGPLDEESVWVEAGVKYGDLAEWLWPRGDTLANVASLGAFGEVFFGTQRGDLLGHGDVNQLVDGDALGFGDLPSFFHQ